MTAKTLTQARLKELLHYDPDTGVFTWVVNRQGHAHAGDIAGYECKQYGYLIIGVEGTLYRAHRLAWLYVHGKFPEGIMDHINGTRDDNAISNLRDVSALDNTRNAGIGKNNVSGVTGVSRSSRGALWRARIMVNRKDIHLYEGDSLSDAIFARKEAEIKYGFHKNHGTRDAY